jgi:hypothetical protein
MLVPGCNNVIIGYELCHCISFEGYILVMLWIILVAWTGDILEIMVYA